MRRETRPRNGIRAPHPVGDGPDAPLTRREARQREELEQRAREQRERDARSHSRRFSRGVSLVAMLSVLGIAVATTVPAMALLSHDDVRARSATAYFSSAPVTEGELQALDSVISAENEAIIRDSGAATSGEQLAALRSMRIADTFRNNPAGAVAPTAGASTDHLGVDFTPGAGVPIQIIADGVVRQVVARDDGGCGVNVTIDHMIGGKLISSKYCHMQAGSVRVSAGQRVAVADIVGRVGNTGISTGAHLHFEIRLNGTEPVDPVAWLKANAS